MGDDGTAILFFYHLLWGFLASLAIALYYAKGVATQATLVTDYNGRALTTFKVDRHEFLKTWGLYTAAGTVVTLVFLLLMQARTYLKTAGYIG